MAAVCDICGKKPFFGKAVTFSHKRNNRRWNPNVQKVRALVDGSPRRVNACTSCIKAGKVTRIPRSAYRAAVRVPLVSLFPARPRGLSVPYTETGSGRPCGASEALEPVR